MHIHNFVLTLAHLEPEAFFKPCETLTRYIQNSAVKYYPAVFRHIQNLVQCLHTQKLGILGILEYSEPFHNYIPTHIQSPVILTKINEYSELTYLKLNTYSEQSQRFMIEFFAKIVKIYNYFPKAHHLRSLARFWICPSLNKYSLTCRVTLRYVLH